MQDTWNPDFDKYTSHFSDFPQKTHGEAGTAIEYFDRDFGRSVEFKRIAVHHVIVPAGKQPSLPHAESLEEEFIFVLKGNADLWLNGYIYRLRVGHAVGFPAGTGIAHTFINNSQNELHLLVAGERTKKENLCSFPVNPEMKDSCNIWWAEAPIHELGPHQGIPGPVKDSELGTEMPQCVLDCTQVTTRESFHYPGDTEVFAEGFRLTNRMDLQALGICYETLPPGKRSAYPHAHTLEEEFVYILKGRLTLWMNGYTKELKEGSFAAFPANTGIAHVLINDTDETVVYLCIGEAVKFTAEKLYYPVNLARSEQLRLEGKLWQDPPLLPFGPHHGLPKNKKPKLES